MKPRPSLILSSARWVRLTAAIPFAVTRKKRFARLPRSGVGSPRRDLTYPFASRRLEQSSEVHLTRSAVASSNQLALFPVARALFAFYTHAMVSKTYIVRLKPPSLALQHVTASSFQIRGEHLVFVDSEGSLAALFLMDLVQSWNVLSG